MKISNVPTALLATLTMAISTATGAAELTPQSLGETFCAAMLDWTIDPLPLTTPELQRLLSDAMDRNAQMQAATPDEKPPLGDGIPWRSWQDQPDGCAVGEIKTSATHSGVTILYSFSDAPEADFEDVLVIGPSDGKAATLGVDDILYATGGTLREAIAAAFAQ